MSKKNRQWSAVKRMIAAAKPWFTACRDTLNTLLSESDACLARVGLAEPFFTDLGAHRWLGEKREEAYSDWLQWVLRQMPPAKIFKLFQASCPDEYRKCKVWSIEREVTILEGKRRLDLVIFACPAETPQPLIVVEIKKGDPEDEPQKLKAYGDWADQENVPRRNRRLLGNQIRIGAESEAAKERSGFRRWGWDYLCVRLRKVARQVCTKKERKIIVGAMMLAFVGAVEQNLLLFSAPSNKVKGAFSRDWPRIAKHLKRSL